MSSPTDTTARPIELPTPETTAQVLVEQPAGAAEEIADVAGQDDVIDHSGEGFELDLGSSRAPVLLFSLLTALAVVLGVYATALPVQIGAGVIAVSAGSLVIRAVFRHRTVQ